MAGKPTLRKKDKAFFCVFWGGLGWPAIDSMVFEHVSNTQILQHCPRL